VWLEKEAWQTKGAIKYQGFDCTPWPQKLEIWFVWPVFSRSIHISFSYLKTLGEEIRNYSKGSNNGYISRVDLSTRKKYFYTSSLFPKDQNIHAQVSLSIPVLPIYTLRNCFINFCDH
jgi:hypothetical protein